MRRIQSLLSRLRAGTPGGACSPPARFKHDAVKAHDEKLYGDWKSMGIVLSDADKRPNLVGRWDWHLWNLLLALVPAGAVFGLAQYARYDMAHNPLPPKETPAEAKSRREREAVAAAVSETQEKEAALEERLEAVEATLRALQRSAGKPEAGTAAAAALAPPPPPDPSRP